MSYSPQNLQIFTASYAGALAGMGVSDRVPTDRNPAHYAGLALVAGAWAQAYDTVWGSRATTLLDVEATQEMSESEWNMRAPQAVTPFFTPATYTSLATAIIAMITAGEAYMTSIGVTPPAIPDGGSGGGSFLMQFAGENTVTSVNDEYYLTAGGLMVPSTVLGENPLAFPILASCTPMTVMVQVGGNLPASVTVEVFMGNTSILTVQTGGTLFATVDPVITYEPQTLMSMKVTYHDAIETRHWILATVKVNNVS